jgi:hypothetical protein
MTRGLVRARPHLVALQDRVEAGPWIPDGSSVPMTDQPLVGWDPSVDIRLTRTVRVDAAGIRLDCALPEAAPLSLAIVWACSATSLRGATTQAVTPDLGDDVGVQLVGAELSGQVVVRLQVVLSSRVEGVSQIAPFIAGSILWEDEQVVVLEGQSARFPMEWLDFAASGWLPAGAGWFLDWSPDEPEMPALGAMRLYINSGHESLSRALAAANPTAAERVVREAIEFDVARTLVTRALASDEFWRNSSESEPGSAGDSVATLIGALFPNDTLEGLRAKWHADPQRIELQLQAAAGLFWNGVA